jgi:DNA-binding Lrp family transcriptional regulator
MTVHHEHSEPEDPQELSGRKQHLSPVSDDRRGIKDLLDKTNRRLIEMLGEDPTSTQLQLSALLNLSQSSVSVRLERLIESGLIGIGYGVNLSKLDLQLAKIEISTEDPKRIIEWAQKCPLLISYFTEIGGETNLTLFFVGEDSETFHWIVDQHIRVIDKPAKLRFSFILPKDDSRPVRLRLYLEEKGEVPPCGALPVCPNCPGSLQYKGKVWSYEEK